MRPNQNGLVAIILAIKSARGEAIVFHYPPNPSHEDATASEETSSIGTDGESEEEILLPRRISQDGSAVDHLPLILEAEESEEPEEQQRPPLWNSIFGLDAALLADIFTPQQSDAKFEMWIDDLVFLGSPVHRRPDGAWLKRKIRGRHLPDETPDDLTPIAEIPNKFESLKAESLPAGSSLMTTFHLVFVLNIKVDETYQKHIKEMYDHVVSQLTFALTYEQARTDYVWKQSEIILDLKRKGHANKTPLPALWQEIEGKSDLASIIAQTYNSIFKDDIAHLLINNQLNLSLLIPREISTAQIQADHMHDHPFLSSAVSFGKTVDDSDPLVMPHFALLLLDEPEKILSALPPGSAPVVNKFIKTIRPTLTFFALAEAMNMPLHDVSTLARHLIHWRCAYPVPPLHPRNIYITSPAADMSRLAKQSSHFAARFPTVPPLANLLSMMSRKMVPFNAFIPSRDHRNLYLGVLTWLMRERWLMEVRLFVWVKVRAEIKLAAAGPEESESFHEDSIIPDPYSANVRERSWLSAIADQHSHTDAALFNRLCKYFNGKHAMEKIPVREGIHRKSLRKLLELYDADLVKAYTW